MSITRGQFDDRSRWTQLLGAGIWLIFLGNPVGELLKRDLDWEQAVGLGATVAFVVVYLRGVSCIRQTHVNRRYRWARVRALALVLLAALTIPGAGDQSLTYVVFVAVLSVASLPKWQALAVAAILFAVTTAAGLLVDGWVTHGSNVAVLLASAAAYSFRLAWQRQGELMAAERELSDLAVEEERARIARDLHDILGHSLTVIAVKAELAERVFDSDPERARSELADLQRLSRDALADVRSTAHGIRGISLPGEIASARMALESAGINPLLPTVADEVPSRWRELFAWTLREGVTNVIRHSQASECTVELDVDSIRVCDDGRGASPGDGNGNGLDGLRQRARLAGATVTTTPGPGDKGFALTVTVPA